MVIKKSTNPINNELSKNEYLTNTFKVNKKTIKKIE